LSFQAVGAVLAMVAQLHAGEPPRLKAVHEPGRELDLHRFFPARQAVLVARRAVRVPRRRLPFARHGEVRAPDQPVVEEILLEEDLAFQLAEAVGGPARLEVDADTDRVLVRAPDAVDKFRRYAAAIVAREGQGGIVVLGYALAGGRAVDRVPV